MMAEVRVEVKIHSFLTSTLVAISGHILSPELLCPGEGVPGIFVGDCVNPQRRLGYLGEEKHDQNLGSHCEKFWVKKIICKLCVYIHMRTKIIG
jgi:hypothetical protein